jgi:surface antigen
MAESNGKGCLVGIGVFGSVVALFLGVGLLDDPPKKEAAAAGGCEVARVGGGGSLEAGKVPNGWGPKVEDAGKEAGTPSGIIAAQIQQESQFNPQARSPVGAQGLTQFMPETWKNVMGDADPMDPEVSIKAQGKYMGQLMDQVKSVAEKSGKDQVSLALAAYNAGPGAVQQFNGVPPFPETQDYVKKITATAGDFQKNLDAGGKDQAQDKQGGKDTGAKTAGCGGDKAGGDSHSTGKDDMPWGNKNLPHCSIENGYTCPEGSVSKTGMFNYECTDWGLWVINRNLGVKGDQDLKVTNSNFRPDGQNLDTAYVSPEKNWQTGWENKGWPMGDKPKEGAIVYYGANAGLAGAMGHIASVQKVNDDGTFVEEGYNGNPPPDDHKYYTRTVKDSEPTKFLYTPDAKDN